MAFSGLHVVCAYAGSLARQVQAAPSLGQPIWSQTFASPGTTTNSSPGAEASNWLGDPVFHIRASADAWCAIGPTPDATTGTRIFVPAGEFVTVYAKAGAKLAWIAA